MLWMVGRVWALRVRAPTTPVKATISAKATAGCRRPKKIGDQAVVEIRKKRKKKVSA